MIETDEIEGNIPLPNVLLKPFLACVALLKEYNVDAGKFVQFLLDKLSIIDAYVVLSHLPLNLPIDAGYNFHESIKDELYETKEVIFKRLLNSTDTASMIKEVLIEYELDKYLSKTLIGYRLVGYIRAKNPFVEETIQEVFSTLYITDTESSASASGFRKGWLAYFIDIDFLEIVSHNYSHFTMGYRYAMEEVFLKRVAAQIDEGISIEEIQRLEMFSDLPTAPPAPEAIETPDAGIPRIIWKGTPGEFGAIMDEFQAKGFIELPLSKKAKAEYLQKRFVVSSNKGTEAKDLLKYFGTNAKRSYLPSEFKLPLSDNSK